MDFDDDALTIGRRLRQIRYARGKSLRVVADLAGMSKSHLSELERGERALDRRSEIVALANVLQVAPSELTKLPVPASANGDTDSGVEAVRVALLAAVTGLPGGDVLDVEVLRDRIVNVLNAQQACRHGTVGDALPDLIRDVHSTIAAGRDGVEVSTLVPLLHVQGTQAWLRDVGAPLDLAWQAAMLSQQAADRVGNPQTCGLAGFGTTHGLLAAGAFDLARAQLEPTLSAVSTATVEGMQLAGMLTFTRSLLAAAEGNGDDVTASLETAADLAERTGEANAYWFGSGPRTLGSGG
ncbi:MAG: helix-turn-helix domain-containing protein [Actinomycetota bacterium]|nr:helix-turn-helix domain-containing protein [Actinomycetota bacterium]